MITIDRVAATAPINDRTTRTLAAPNKGITARTPGNQGIVAATAHQGIITTPAHKILSPIACLDRIVATTADKGVVPARSIDPIVAGPALNIIITGRRRGPGPR